MEPDKRREREEGEAEADTLSTGRGTVVSGSGIGQQV